MENIGTKIVEIRKRKGLSQEELADQAGVNLRTIQRIEKDQTTPHGNTLRGICNALEISIDNIIDYGKRADKKLLVWFHLSVLSFVFMPAVGNILFPLIIWLTNRDKVISLNEKGARLLNFQILWSLLFCSSVIFMVILKLRHHPESELFAYSFWFLYVLNLLYAVFSTIAIARGRKGHVYPLLIKII